MLVMPPPTDRCVGGMCCCCDGFFLLLLPPVFQRVISEFQSLILELGPKNMKIRIQFEQLNDLTTNNFGTEQDIVIGKVR